MYEIIDRQTGARVGKPYQSHERARRRVDRLDNEYGAYRYHARPVPAEIISLDARRISRALQHAHEIEDVALDFGPKEF